MSPSGPFEAAVGTTIELAYTAGSGGLVRGSLVKFALPNNGWGEPLLPYARGCPEIYTGRDRRYARWWPQVWAWRSCPT